MRRERPAIAMLELIFSLVIMGIVLMSAPMLISTGSKSGYVAIQQEAINEASSQINLVMNYPWDEAMTDDQRDPPLLGVSNLGDPELEMNPATGTRNGTPRFSKRSFIDYNNKEFNASTVLGDEGGDNDDLDDFIGTTNLRLVQTTDADYIETTTISMNTQIAYMPDNANFASNPLYFSLPITPTGFVEANNSTNIKSITVTLTSTVTNNDVMEKTITMRAFSCNIGATKFEERRL